MSAKGGVAVVILEMVKFFCRAMDVRKSVKLKTCVNGSDIERGGTGSLPSPEMSRAMWRKSPPIGVNGWGLKYVSYRAQLETEVVLTASIIPSPGVKTRPLTMLNALVSGRLFCRPSSRWSPTHDPIICASIAFHIRHNGKRYCKKECGKEYNSVIAQQRWASR
jgi:hypothetical protein